jgi:predicted membrane channel-forming protein YqfA (hemolysin III family)
MVLSDIVTANNVALALVLGGLLAIFTALYGKKEKSFLDEILMIVGFFFGAFLVFMGIQGAVMTPRPVAPAAIAVTLALGLAMFLKPLRKIPFSMIVSLISGGVIAYFLIKMNLSATWVLIITLIVMAIVWIMLKFLGIGVRIAEWILSARPIMFIVGIIGLIEGILIWMGNTL